MKTHVVQTFPIPAPELEMGQPITAIAVALAQSGAPIDKGPVTMSSTFPEVAVVQPTTGQILAINSGMTQIIATVAGKVVIGPSQSHLTDFRRVRFHGGAKQRSD